MKRYLIILLSLFSTGLLSAQELYVYTEPASNMPTNSISTRLAGMAGPNAYGPISSRSLVQRYVPEMMFGLSKNWMGHVGATLSNMNTPVMEWESVFLYGKYRFISKDEVHRHFRMAAFMDGSLSWNKHYLDEISLTGNMSGVQAGVIATQLLHRLALSSTGSFTKAFYRTSEHDHGPRPDKAVNLSLSAGYLVLPIEYKSYDQLNFNVYTEILSQKVLGSDKYFVDIAPAVQFIFGSHLKVNLGYRTALKQRGTRNMNRSYLVAVEHTIFNALKRPKGDRD